MHSQEGPPRTSSGAVVLAGASYVGFWGKDAG